MSPYLQSLLLAGLAVVGGVDAQAQVDTSLTGTWTTKSRKVFTGPVRSFHNPFHPAIVALLTR